MSALAKSGCSTAGFLTFCQDQPRVILDRQGQEVENLYAFLKGNSVHVVINQIGYSRWLLQEFLNRGGQRWKEEGGRIITCLHFDPLMFSETLSVLIRHWGLKTPTQKIRRLGRIVLLPFTKHKAARNLRQAYTYLIEHSDYFVILSEKHRQKLYEMSQTQYPDRVRVIPNPNTFTVPYSKDKVREKRKTALIVSRLDEPQKRISMALRAWGRVMRTGNFDNWTLQVLGDGEYGDDYRELVSKKRIQNVEFIGRTDPDKYYESASLYLHTAKREGWGLTITEAMQKGVVPIVMNSSTIFEEMIDNEQNGVLSQDNNVALFAAHISDLINNNDKRERMALRALEATMRNDLNYIVKQWHTLLTI